MKKVLSLGIVSLIALSTLTSFTYASNDGRRMMGSGSTGSGRVLNLVCAQQAVATREASIRWAYVDLTSGLLQGLDTRAKDLDLAWTIENTDNRRVARDTAWSNWKATAKSARDAFRTSRKTSWDTFRTSMKACNVPATEIDSARTQALDVQ